jgi:predicted GH43/DUF377 family glycosyl hydrolase/glycosyltransferase involved in cell wall biosynthesis
MKPLHLIAFNNSDLVPDKWKVRIAHAPLAQNGQAAVSGEPATDFYVFNPTIARHQDGYVMTYRVVDEVHKTRFIASCKLNTAFDIVPGSVTPVSDLITFAPGAAFTERTLTWHADPRYFRLGGDLYLFWNDGSLKPANHQFLQKIGADGLTPEGHPRLVRKDPHEARIEKNWQFINVQESVYAIHENRPLHLLAVDTAGQGDITCREFQRTDWPSNYEEKFGHIRGGAQPVLHDGTFLTLAHSSHKNSHGKLVYQACFYRFDAQSPFKVTHRPKGPFMIPVEGADKHKLPRLNTQVAQVIYPCGLLVEGGRAIISFGVNDESAAVGVFNLSEVLDSMEPIAKSTEEKNATVQMATPHAQAQRSDLKEHDQRVPLFWWNAQGKRFDPEAGGRFFGVGNVGDIASRDFVEMLSSLESRSPRKGERKLLCIGSILQNASNGDVVWGSGIKGSAEGFKNPVHELSVHAVRGPLTVEFLRRQGILLTQLKELFDPGCLIPYLYADELREVTPKVRDVCIIPHYKDDLILRQQHPKLADGFVSVDASPLDFVKQLVGAKLVVSSSLHGIIFAEALGIPSLWLAPVNGEDELKYYDYYYGTNRYNVKRFTTIESALRSEPMNLPRFRYEDYLRSFPGEAIRSLCAALPPGPEDRLAEMNRPIGAPAASAMAAFQPWALDTLRTQVAVSEGRPASLALTKAISQLRSRHIESGLVALYRLATSAQTRHETRLRTIVDQAALLYLGYRGFWQIAERVRHQNIGSPDEEVLHQMLVEALHEEPGQRIFQQPSVLAIAIEIGEKKGVLPWQILCAFAHRKSGHPENEVRLLNDAHRAAPSAFWSSIQQVYRFTVSIPALNALVGAIKIQQYAFGENADKLHVFCFPTFNQSNCYQQLLYQEFVAYGHSVTECRKISELEAIKPCDGFSNVLHIHWISAFFKNVEAADFRRRAARILVVLRRIKNDGVKLVWTIHNSISHDSVDVTQEAEFEQQLYRLVDHVYVHHPMAVHHIGWLPDMDKIHLMEHGSYGCEGKLTKTEARHKMGFNFDGPLISVIGQIREYKDFEKCLPHILKVLNKFPDARFLVAGKIYSPVLKHLLTKKRRDQLIVIDRVLSSDELHACMDATDFGLLTYREILTSGSVIHWLSRGVPVIAPAKGTIPAYVVPDWNGALYENHEQLADTLTNCLTSMLPHANALSQNALQAGISMTWHIA